MTKYYFYTFLLLFGIASSCNQSHSQKKEFQKKRSPIENLLTRIAPDHVDNFLFVKTDDPGKGVFEIQSKSEKIVINGNDYNSMAVGLNYYLKKYCNVHVSWYFDDKFDMPEVLPTLTKTIRKSSKVENRFFLNYCTFGYTMPWWQWEDWERFIDWMALNGINMPLAITGQEAIWYEVWKEYGLTDEQIRSYFTGPAHLPWHRMSNLDKWGGMLPISWLENQKELQIKILERERELGMKPVLPAFAGHVPQDLKTQFPEAKINQLTSWGGFEDEYRSFFLDPLDPLFEKIQHKFLAKQTEAFGTDHIYGADPFNEVHPPSWEPDYLATVANSIYTSMQNVDKNATWLQMSWIFYFEREHWTNERIEAMVTAVPRNKMMLLDYYCENKEVWRITDSFFNQPFVWCYLGNFGGNTMLAGNLNEVDDRMEDALNHPNGNLQGVGSTLEALDVNPIMYNYVFEKVWDDGDTDLNEWVVQWARSRYGSEEENYERAWKTLYEHVYSDPAKLGQATLSNARPTLKGSGNWTTNPDINYNNQDLFMAWELMLIKPGNTQSYEYDIVNIGRQVLGNHFKVLRDEFTEKYYAKDLTGLKEKGNEMLVLLEEMDELLSTNTSFLLGKWLSDAKKMGINKEEKKYFEQNARNIITTWGTKAQSLNDYGNRSWSGLMKGYYKKRWKMFIEDVTGATERQQAFDEEAFLKKVTQFEWDWVLQNEEYSDTVTASSTAIATAQKLMKKYRKDILKM